MPLELIKKFWALYEQLKAGNLPDTLPEIASALRLVADVLDYLGGTVSTAAAMSQHEAEALIAALVAGEPTAQAGLAGPALRELLKFALPLLQDLIRKQFS